jgi:hypothetical protein
MFLAKKRFGADKTAAMQARCTAKICPQRRSAVEPATNAKPSSGHNALTAATPRDDAIVYDLRYTLRLLTTAIWPNAASRRGGSERPARSRVECAQCSGRIIGPTNAHARDDRSSAGGRRGGARSACGLSRSRGPWPPVSVFEVGVRHPPAPTLCSASKTE